MKKLLALMLAMLLVISLLPMAVLADDSKLYPPLEFVCTADEERGMTVHRTDLEGTIVYTSNGAEFTRVQ